MSNELPKLPSTISYSGLSNFDLCPKYFELVNVKKLKAFEDNANTVFGKYIHKYCQELLQDKISENDAVLAFKRRWKCFVGLYKQKEFETYITSGENIIRAIKGVLTQTFGIFKVLHVELRLSAPSGIRFSQKFKGFVDLVLELESGDRVIADLKTAESAYFFNKYRDVVKDRQLILYKYFYCQEEKSDLDKIETYFFVLEKNPKSKNPVSVLRVTSGKVKIKNCMEWLDKILSAVNREKFPKNRLSCRKFGDKYPCYFLDTECSKLKLL